MDQPRRVFTPQISRKRKEREELPFLNSSVRGNNTTPRNIQPTSPTNTSSFKPVKPMSSNRLLAGYMAYEFLTKGTLLGQKFDPARAEALPVALSDPKKKPIQDNNSNSSSSGNSATGSGPEAAKPVLQSYAEVANLLKTDGAHIPGIVNPTQLARWIQM